MLATVDLATLYLTELTARNTSKKIHTLILLHKQEPLCKCGCPLVLPFATERSIPSSDITNKLFRRFQIEYVVQRHYLNRDGVCGKTNCSGARYHTLCFCTKTYKYFDSFDHSAIFVALSRADTTLSDQRMAACPKKGRRPPSHKGVSTQYEPDCALQIRHLQDTVSEIVQRPANRHAATRILAAALLARPLRFLTCHDGAKTARSTVFLTPPFFSCASH